MTKEEHLTKLEIRFSEILFSGLITEVLNKKLDITDEQFKSYRSFVMDLDLPNWNITSEMERIARNAIENEIKNDKLNVKITDKSLEYNGTKIPIYHNWLRRDEIKKQILERINENSPNR